MFKIKLQRKEWLEKVEPVSHSQVEKNIQLTISQTELYSCSSEDFDVFQSYIHLKKRFNF